MNRLKPPVSEADHRSGPEDAPVTLVEYGDYECPHCARAHAVVQAIRQVMGPRLQFVFRNYPLVEAHPHSVHAAEAAEVAGSQGMFWEMHDLLFENQEALEDSDLIDYAERIGIDAVRVAEDLASGVHEPTVREHFRSGVRSSVNGTPTFFINGVRYDGPCDLEPLLQALDRAAGES